MALTLVTGPAQNPVTLAETKAHIRVDHTYDDSAITSYILSATEHLDGRDGLLGRCLITQTWRQTLDSFPAEILLPLPPCQSVGSITYVDSNGATQTLATSEYQVIGIGAAEGTRIRPAYGKSWPSIRAIPDAISITFTAGYGDDPEDVPEPVRAAIMSHVGTLYEMRASVTETGFVKPLPHGSEDLIRQFRTWSF